MHSTCFPPFMLRVSDASATCDAAVGVPSPGYQGDEGQAEGVQKRRQGGVPRGGGHRHERRQRGDSAFQVSADLPLVIAFFSGVTVARSPLLLCFSVEQYMSNCSRIQEQPSAAPDSGACSGALGRILFCTVLCSAALPRLHVQPRTVLFWPMMQSSLGHRPALIAVCREAPRMHESSSGGSPNLPPAVLDLLYPALRDVSAKIPLPWESLPPRAKVTLFHIQRYSLP